MKRLLFFLLAIVITQLADAQLVTTYAGNGSILESGDNGPAVNAGVPRPNIVTFDKNGNLYIGEIITLRKVAPTGIITHYAGNGTSGPIGDGGLSADARLTAVMGMVCDAENNLYISDAHRIRKINASDGIINTIAGSNQGFSGDGGQAINATFNMVGNLVMDSQGNLYVADRNNYRIRRIDASGIVTTIAGNGATGNAGDGGQALNAQLNDVIAMCIDGNDNLYIADQIYVRKIDLGTGVITRFAGTDTGTVLNNGIPALEAIVGASGLTADKDNNIYISSIYNHMIRVVDQNGIIHFVSGEGTIHFLDNVNADSACFNEPRGMAFDTCGNLFIADGGNRRVRKVWFNAGCYNLSVNEKASFFECSFSPNPVASQLTITCSNKINSISIIDITGREVLRSTETTIDMTGLVSGVYFVRVRDENGGVVVERVVKE